MSPDEPLSARCKKLCTPEGATTATPTKGIARAQEIEEQLATQKALEDAADARLRR